MNSANFHFQDELKVFLSPARQGVAFDYPFSENPTVKHLFEALGVPHTEVSAVRVNGRLVPFSYRVQSGDQIEILPALPPEGAEPGLGNASC
jgi:sulfur carrier protein ThiS